jgi:hypothetical protein
LIRCVSSGMSVKADPTKGDVLDQVFGSTINVSVEL